MNKKDSKDFNIIISTNIHILQISLKINKINTVYNIEKNKKSYLCAIFQKSGFFSIIFNTIN